ncbi:MAG: PaaI family thioesterase [Acidimicrobiales bacterium]
MTDISSQVISVPGRLGVQARFDGGELTLELVPTPATLHHGVVRASVLSFAVDAVAGITLDQDPEAWTFTSDMSVRMRPVPAPGRIVATNTVLRQGRRSATCRVELTADDGRPIADGAIGFVNVPRKEGDPPKFVLRPDQAPDLFDGIGTLTRPLRDEAAIQVIDAEEGIVQVDVTPALRNPAGTLQGAMVALVAEAAAEDLVTSRYGSPAVVTDLDLRYLAQAKVGPVRTRTRLLGDRPDAPMEIELVDLSTDRITTLVYARAVAIS